MNVVKEALRSQRYLIKRWLKTNMLSVSQLLMFSFPFLTFGVGVMSGAQTGGFEIVTVALLFILSLLFWFVVNLIESISNHLNGGQTMPVPETRFTTVDEFGEVTVEVERLHEMLIFLSEFEDHAERKGLFNGMQKTSTN